MIKGIYNENEFYTNFYWDNKFLEDLRSKMGGDISAEAAIGALKGLDAQFWTLKELPEEDPKHIEALVEFYKSLFGALGYEISPTNHQTSSGQFLSLFANVRRTGAPDLFAVLVGKSESGAFESPPLFVGSDAEAVDIELAEIIQDEFQESQNPPRWILVGAPNALFVIERNKWSFGRYLRIEWQEVFLQRDAKPYELLAGIASKKILCPDVGSSPHDEFDESSHRHAFEVTTELRESVREAIELLINEMIDLKKESHQKIYSSESADQYANELTHDALYYVYRLLFLLYLEAQGDDSELLPLKSEVYRNGYSLEKLLELDYVDVAPDSAESKGTFLFESLDQIFNLIFFGFEPEKEGIFKSESGLNGFLVKGIKSDLFDPSVIKHLKGVKIRNGVLLDILKKLSLTRKKERGGKARARVSYANLGINQLGAVYEGLLSYSGFFAQEELHALKPASVRQSDLDRGIELDQVYLAPKSLVDQYRKSSEKKYKLSVENTVLDENGNPKIYRKGSFIYRLAGRDRQKLASYYTPESLTKTTVKYSLNVLLGSKKTLSELWSVKILEPAMGSGAFLNEAVNQLADRILAHEVDQGVGDLKTPKAKQARLSGIKYQLISNNVYGVDLNPTAIELARFSLWLNCIGAGKEPPSFANRLKIGNSLIGARFEKGADGIFPWLLIGDGVLEYGKKLAEYDPVGFERILSFREQLLRSRLDGSDETIKLLNKKAAKAFQNVVQQPPQGEREESYRRLKLCCDLWCSLHFASSKDLDFLPKSHEELCGAYLEILDGKIINKNLMLLVLGKFEAERFFHWSLEFPDIIASGGFDLILGNPPWVAVEWQDSLYLTDYNVIPSVLELSAPETRKFIDGISDDVKSKIGSDFIRTKGYLNLLDDPFYALLEGATKNTYKAFDVLALHLLNEGGVFGVIQEDGLLEERKAQAARLRFYRALKYHFQFQNEKALFAEVHNAKRFSVNVFTRSDRGEVCFDHIGNLFLPKTIDESYSPAEGDVPLIKDGEGNWETRGHGDRVIKVTQDVLHSFSEFLGDSENESPVLLNLHSRQLLNVINVIGTSNLSIGTYFEADEVSFSDGLNEVNAQDDGIIAPSAGRARSLGEVILSGPNIEALNPFSKETLEVYKSNKSYESIDLTTIKSDFIPRTLYKYKVDPASIEKSFNGPKGTPYRRHFRLLTRGMVNPSNERSLFFAIIPPGPMHINGLKGFATDNAFKLVVAAGFLASLVLDGVIRLKNKTNIFAEDIRQLPVGEDRKFWGSIARRALYLNGLSAAYRPLWGIKELIVVDDGLLTGEPLSIAGSGEESELALRSPSMRRQAYVEIDALVALSFGIGAVELSQVYRILFPVLSMYDRQAGFDRSAELIRAHKAFQERGW